MLQKQPNVGYSLEVFPVNSDFLKLLDFDFKLLHLTKIIPNTVLFSEVNKTYILIPRRMKLCVIDSPFSWKVKILALKFR